MKKETMMSLAIAAIMATPALAQANSVGSVDGGPGATVGGGGQGGPGAREHGGRRGGGQRFAKVEAVLNPQQKEQFKQIMEQSRAEGRPLMQKMFAMRQQMQGGSNMDDKTKADFVAVRKQLKAHHEAVQSKIEGLLTADQKAQLEKTGGMPKFGEHGSWSGGGGEGGPGGAGGGRGRHRRGGGDGASDFNSPATPPLPPGQ
jgi:Spy/CpxP family protein refolding chaperone